MVGALVCTLLAVALGGGQPFPHSLPTAIQDDALLLHGSDESVWQAMSQVSSLGARYVRLTAGWSAISPMPDSRRMPGPPFDPSNPRTYPGPGFSPLDRAVSYAHRLGMDVMIDIAFWAPRWAVARGDPNRQYRYMPNPTLYGEFARAVAARYSGSFSTSAGPLPAVRLYTIWNEPNNAGFLEPQWRRTAEGWIPESPHIYRGLYYASYPQIKSANPGAQVLIGATAANGSPAPGQGGVPPLDFVRSLSCVNRLMFQLQIPECQDYRPLTADGYAHHPYSLDTTPATHATNPGSIPLADVGRLETQLNLLALTGRISGQLPVYETEYGYFTNPPDPFVPYTPADQAKFIGWSTFLAWQDPRTQMFSQFLLRDSDTGPGPAGKPSHYLLYQTGLYYHDGRPKPAAEAFRLPFWVQPLKGPGPPSVLLFGQVRAAPPGIPQVVEVQRRTPSGSWTPVRASALTCFSHDEFTTDRAGFFLAAAPSDGATTFRLAWDRNGTFEYGPPISTVNTPPLSIARSKRQRRSHRH